MSDAIHTTRDFETNGYRVPAGEVSVEQLRDTVKIQDKDGPRPMTEVEAKSALNDLMQRQARHDKYREGITEKHEYMSSAGTMAVGSGAE